MTMPLPPDDPSLAPCSTASRPSAAGGLKGPALTRSARGARDDPRSGRKNARGAGRTKE
jgi:hypothetical protein